MNQASVSFILATNRNLNFATLQNIWKCAWQVIKQWFCFNKSPKTGRSLYNSHTWSISDLWCLKPVAKVRRLGPSPQSDSPASPTHQGSGRAKSDGWFPSRSRPKQPSSRSTAVSTVDWMPCSVWPLRGFTSTMSTPDSSPGSTGVFHQCELCWLGIKKTVCHDGQTDVAFRLHGCVCSLVTLWSLTLWSDGVWRRCTVTLQWYLSDTGVPWCTLPLYRSALQQQASLLPG